MAFRIVSQRSALDPPYGAKRCATAIANSPRVVAGVGGIPADAAIVASFGRQPR
jgi:hypothetical protein